MGALRWLATEAFSDAVRRRIVPAICAVALISLLFLDSCTGCVPVVSGPDGEPMQLPGLAGVGGLLVYAVLSLWVAVLAGVLASDHLAEPLSDGSANLVLARPISRASYALARLLGAWGLAAGTGIVLLGATAWLLAVRQGLPVGPAMIALALALLNALTVASFAMALSLGVGRTLTSLAVFVSVWGIGGLQALRAAPLEIDGWMPVAADVAPPLVTAVVAPLAVWLGPEAPELGDPIALAARALAWATASVGVLILAFRRTELGR